MKKYLIGATIATAMLFTAVPMVFGATNPSGTGQPSASCGSPNATVQPNGFSTQGFTSATLVYAGSPGSASLLNSNSPKAISQYDVACYQLTNR